MSKFKNARTEKFLTDISICSIDLDTDQLSTKCKFNFAYFEKQQVSQDFSDWTHDQLAKLLNKLKDYSRETLLHWTMQPIGSSGNVLSVYGDFPIKTEFKKPKHVPHQAKWARFRLESADRLVGFVLPKEYHQVAHKKSNERFDCNTFYVVYLDSQHKFWVTEKK
jgi:hypothetical protein